LEYVPLHLSALDVSSGLEAWIRSWWISDYGNLITLTPEGWFSTVHQGGCYLWAPAPAAIDVVVEQLGEARHKRPWSTHVVVIPRIMTGRWRGNMIKETNFWVEIPAELPFWEADRYEPLTLLLAFPLLDRQPWNIIRTPLLDELSRELRKMWKQGDERSRSFLRELLLWARKLRIMPAGMVWTVLHRPAWKSFSNSSGDG